MRFGGRGLPVTGEADAEWIPRERQGPCATSFSTNAFSSVSTPAAYAASLPATCDRLRNTEQLRRSRIAQPAPNGVKPAVPAIVA